MDEPHTPIRKSYFFDPSDPLFADHFPGCPVIPGSLLLHCFQNSIESASESISEATAAAPLQLQAIRNARFIRFGRPGWLEVEVAPPAGKPGERMEALIFSCTARQKGELLAAAQLFYGHS